MKILSILGLLCLTFPVCGEVQPAPVFRDHMVLQRDMPIIVWGTADTGQKITVTLGNAKSETNHFPHNTSSTVSINRPSALGSVTA